MEGLQRTINIGDSPRSTVFRSMVDTELTAGKSRTAVPPPVSLPELELPRVSIPHSVSQSLLESLAPEVVDYLAVTPSGHIRLLSELRNLLDDRAQRAASISTRSKITGAVQCLQEEEHCREILENQRRSQYVM